LQDFAERFDTQTRFAKTAKLQHRKAVLLLVTKGIFEILHSTSPCEKQSFSTSQRPKVFEDIRLECGAANKLCLFEFPETKGF